LVYQDGSQLVDRIVVNCCHLHGWRKGRVGSLSSQGFDIVLAGCEQGLDNKFSETSRSLTVSKQIYRLCNGSTHPSDRDVPNGSHGAAGIYICAGRIQQRCSTSYDNANAVRLLLMSLLKL
jgi:hypothetical protein